LYLLVWHRLTILILSDSGLLLLNLLQREEEDVRGGLLTGFRDPSG